MGFGSIVEWLTLPWRPGRPRPDSSEFRRTRPSPGSPLFFGLRNRRPEFSAHPIIETFPQNSLSAKFLRQVFTGFRHLSMESFSTYASDSDRGMKGLRSVRT